MMSKPFRLLAYLTLPAMLASCATVPSKQDVDRKLGTLVIPVIEFKGAEPQAVLAFMTTESRKVDPQKQGVQFVLAPSSVPYRRIEPFRLVNIPLRELTKFVSYVSGCKFRIEGGKVVFSHVDEP